MPDQSQIFFSIIVPTYNRANLISSTLSSLQNQDYGQYEIIVVDDGSTDNTEEVVKKISDKRITYIKKKNAERASARNFGVTMAKGEYVNFFDSDDLALPNHLTEAVKVININKAPQWFHLSFAIANSKGKVIRNADNYTLSDLNQQLIEGNILSCNGVFIRKDIIVANKFNEDRQLSASEDYELWCRLAARFPLYYSNTVTSLVIDHEMRSVRKINAKQLIKRLNLLIFYLQNDPIVITCFGKDFKKIEMYASSYIAVHLSSHPSFKLKGIVYLIKAFRASKAITRKKVFYATIKNLLIKWQKY